MEYTKTDLERELVTKDKQNCITICMKMLEQIQQIDNVNGRISKENKRMAAELDEKDKELDRLRSLTFWQFVNGRIEAKRDVIRARNIARRNENKNT
jgi:hypothetical protein